VLDAVPDFFYSSGGTRLVEEIERVAASVPDVGGVESHLTLLRQVALALGEEPPLSQLPGLAVADLAVLAEMSAERMSLRRLLVDQGDATRIRLYVNSPDYVKSVALRAALDRRLTELDVPDFVTVHASGDLPVALEVVGEIVGNQIRSIGWAMLSVAIVLIFAFGRGFTGLVAMVPVTAATIFVLGGMGALGVPLGIATSMFASLTVGVGVDFGIHFLHRYRVERARGSSDAAALEATVQKTGAALRWNALVLALGFAVLSFSSLKPNHSLGLLLAAAMITCLIATLLFLPRLARLAVGLAAALLIAGSNVPSASAAPLPCARPPDPAARALMAELESDLRSGTHVIHMHIETRVPERRSPTPAGVPAPAPKTLWAVLDNDERETRTVYLFSGPGRLAGTTLLMRDRVATLEGDAMWLYLRSFQTFTKIESTARRRTVVPGTSLTYEDAKGFISTDKYTFSFTQPASERGAEAGILACPTSPALASDLGYRELLVEVDLAKNVVRSVDYRDLAGKPLKRYVVEKVRLSGDRWRPERALLEHQANGTVSPIRYEFWRPAERPPKALYEPSVDSGAFRPRVVGYLETIGLGEHIRGELEAADASVRGWEEKWNQPAEPSE
jgi:hypothetical protein